MAGGPRVELPYAAIGEPKVRFFLCRHSPGRVVAYGEIVW